MSNVRTDRYGGNIENRARFALEVVDAVVDAVGPEKTGIRLSPWNTFQGMGMKDPKPTFGYLVQEIKNNHPNLSYIHVVEPRETNSQFLPADNKNDFLREIWRQEGNARWFISAGGHTRELAMQKADNKGDLIAFGKLFIANVGALHFPFSNEADGSIARPTIPFRA